MRHGRASREQAGFTLTETMISLAIMGVVAAMALPAMVRFQSAQDTQDAAIQVGSMLTQVRERARTQGNPYLILFQQEDVDPFGRRTPFALIVRDRDASYSVTPADDVRPFVLPEHLGKKITQYGEGNELPYAGAMKLASGDYSEKIHAYLENVVSGSGCSGSECTYESLLMDDEDESSLAVSEEVLNGTTFAVHEGTGVPAIAFSPRGVPVALGAPNQWGTGAGAVYITNNREAVFVAILSPMGEVSIKKFRPGTGSWQ